MKPAEANFSVYSTPNQEKRVMWIQTLPDLVQARVLSFLAYDYQRLCNKDFVELPELCRWRENFFIFWVKKAAEKLLDLVSVCNYQWLSDLNLDSEEEHVENEFQSVPDWLRDVAKDNEPLFSWLPISPDESNLKTPSCVFGGSEDESSIGVEKKKERFGCGGGRDVVEGMAIDVPLDAIVENEAKSG